MAKKTDQDISELKWLEIDADLLVAGHIATHWCDTGTLYKCPMPGWGGSIRRGSINVGVDTWVVNRVRGNVDGKLVMGVNIVKHIGALNGGNDKKGWWFPFSSCKDIKIGVYGRELEV